MTEFNLHSLSTGEVDFINLSSGQTITVYDSGGPASEYGSNEDLHFTFNAPENQVLTISGEYFTETNYDFLKLYDGTSSTSTQLFDSKTDFTTKDGLNTITGIQTTQKSLHATFTSDNGVVKDGFNLEISAVEISQTIDNAKSSFDALTTTAARRDFTADNVTVTFDLPLNTHRLYHQTYNVTVTFSESTSLYTRSSLYEETALVDTSQMTGLELYLDSLSTGGSINLDPGQEITVYDSGGPGSPYGSNEDINFTFNAPADHVLVISGDYFTETDYDFLKLYDGTSSTSTQLFNSKNDFTTKNGLNTITGSLQTTQASLHATFTSDTYNVKDGFKLIISVVSISPIPAPICFPKGTPVTTDQGQVSIEKLNPDKHTIRGRNIVAITQTIPLQKHIVSIEKNALGKNVPSQTTQISKNHKVFYKRNMIKAQDLVDVCEHVHFIPYNRETLYNVLLEEYDKMIINNLICETLDPKNIMAKIINSNISSSEKYKIYSELTNIIKKNDVSGYKKLYSYLN